MFHKYLLASLALVVSICTVALAQVSSGKDLVVTTAEGNIRGREIIIGNKKLHAFLGIRYAETPVRWQRPVARQNFHEEEDARSAGPVCPQLDAKGNVTGDEDCLFLDIIVGGIDKRGQKPVLVYISNENRYQTGTSHTGALLAKKGNLAVVVVYSRLGALGYHYDGPGTGNLGLWDNLAALSWIEHNIAVFRGDPSRVTVMGLDSGATIAQLLAASPRSDGLFHQVIAMSPLNVDAFGLQPSIGDKKVLKILANCSADTCDTDKASVEDIVRYMSSSKPNIMDEDIFPNGFSHQRLAKLNYLSGVTSAEELLLTHTVVQKATEGTNGSITQEVMDNIVRSVCEAAFMDAAAQCLCINGIRTRFQVDDRSPYPLQEVEPIISALLHSNFISIVENHSKANASTYAYSVDILEELQLTGLPENAHFSGSDKSIMSKLVFGYPFLGFGDKFNFLNKEFYNDQLLTGADPTIMFGRRIKLRPQSQDVMRYWANFVNSGHPGKGVKDMEWEQYGASRRSFLTIDSTAIVRSHGQFRAAKAYEYFNRFFYQSVNCIKAFADQSEMPYINVTAESTNMRSVGSTISSDLGAFTSDRTDSQLAQIIFSTAGNIPTASDSATTRNIVEMATSADVEVVATVLARSDDFTTIATDANTTAMNVESSTNGDLKANIVETNITATIGNIITSIDITQSVNTTNAEGLEVGAALVVSNDITTEDEDNSTTAVYGESSTTGDMTTAIEIMNANTTTTLEVGAAGAMKKANTRQSEDTSTIATGDMATITNIMKVNTTTAREMVVDAAAVAKEVNTTEAEDNFATAAGYVTTITDIMTVSTTNSGNFEIVDSKDSSIRSMEPRRTENQGYGDYRHGR